MRPQSLIASRNLEPLLRGIHTQEPVAGLTHGFYKYPARFSPLFTRAVIESFTCPGDVVYDPFMGGGTTLVEAVALGRRAIGTDINSLAVFLAQVKTTYLAELQITRIRSFIEQLMPKLTVWAPAQRANEWATMGYQRNINTKETWRIRKVSEIVLDEIGTLKTVEEQRFVRCILLRTGQWALDCRKHIPSIESFRQHFQDNAENMIAAAQEYADLVRRRNEETRSDGAVSQAQCLHRSAVGAETDTRLLSCGPIKLVLTSPPYPGVHVLYHRWQVRGRRETPAPFWIAASHDGNGAAYYTFGDRKEENLDSYYEQALAAFSSITRIADQNTIFVQMVAFPEPSWQLPRYLDTMHRAGLKEMRFPKLAGSMDGRVWRSVPGRKWYASQKGSIGSSNEVVLFHRKA